MEAKKAKKRQALGLVLPMLTNLLNITLWIMIFLLIVESLIFLLIVESDIAQGEVADGLLLYDDLSEPTMGEKLGGLRLLDDNKFRSGKEQESTVPAKPPSADSVHVLLTQALRADDRTLLLDCLYTQDEKVHYFLLSYVYFRIGSYLLSLFLIYDMHYD